MELPRFEPVKDARPVDAAWPGMTWPPAEALRGPVVELRPGAPADVDDLFTALDHDSVWTHLHDRPRTPGGWAAFMAKGGRFPWTVRLARPVAGLVEGTVVGTTSYLDVSQHDARLEIGSTAYTPAVWGSAVNPAAKFLLLEHAFEVLSCGRVQIKTDVRNTRSQQAIARLGASYEGTLRRYQRRDDGSVRDTVLFSVLADEWPGVKQRLITRMADCSV